MMRLRKKAALSLFFALFLLSFSACDKRADHNLIRIGVLEGPSAVSFIKMIDKEHVIEGRKVEITIKSEPFQIQAMMMKKELDFAILPTVMAANLFNKGVGYRMLACPIWGTLYLVSSSEKVQTLKDLEGEKIAVFGRSSTADILTKRMLANENVAYKGIDYRFGTNHELAQAFMAGEVKNAVVSEPLVSVLLDKMPDAHIVEELTCRTAEDMSVNYFVQSAFVVSDRFVKNHSHLIPKVCNAYMNSCNFVNENPEAVAELLVLHNIMPNTDVAIKSIELCNINYVAAFALFCELHYYLNVFYSEFPESIGGKIPEKDFVYQVYSASHNVL